MTSLIKDPDTAKIGEIVVVGGLFFQCALLAGFLCVVVVWNWRLRGLSDGVGVDGERAVNWLETGKWLKMIYVISLLIFGRSIFRAVEYLLGHDGSFFRSIRFSHSSFLRIPALPLLYLNTKYMQ